MMVVRKLLAISISILTRHIAHLCRLVSMAEIDALLQTVMFTIYGNQYESREEHLLLTMFQVCCQVNGQ